jgi:segregation and condensation protein B
MMELSDIVGETRENVQSILDEMKGEMEDRKSALAIARVAEGYQFASREGFGYWVKKLFRDQTTFRLSQSALETLAIVAYKQPITRGEIEEIRGVEVAGVLETLMERKLVKVAGRKESVGRPLLYSTTQDFLRHFNLWKVSDLPSLEDLAREAERKRAAETLTGEPVAAKSPAMTETRENPPQDANRD